ncbi:SIR2 family protein [Natronospora cellulosivora (SeqCode)]
MSKHISFLFGAGISVPAGLPSTKKISNKVINGQALGLEGYESKRLIPFIKTVYKKLQSSDGKESFNFEDLYYICSQLKGYWQEYDNPVVLSFIDDIIDDLVQIKYFKILSNKNELRMEISRLAEKTINFMNAVISKSLNKNELKIDYFKFLEEINNDNRISSLNIFTLNYDLLLEKYFYQEKISFYDGFIKNKGSSIRVWQGDFIKASEKIKLLKIHGSVNWYRCRKSFENDYSYFFANTGIDISNKKEISSHIVQPKPMILAGRFNKILEYNRSIYVDLHYSFYRLLDLTETIFISGYSFNDLGINTWLIDWMYSSKTKKIILIHPEPEACIANARPGIQEHYKKWHKDKFISLSIPIQLFSWQKYSRLLKY